MVAPFTGPTAESGRYQVPGAKLAVDEINKATVGNGRQFELVVEALCRAAHERLVDDPPWLFTVLDLNPRVMGKRVHEFVSAQSWFADLTPVGMH
jgi:hypothetical protein